MTAQCGKRNDNIVKLQVLDPFFDFGFNLNINLISIFLSNYKTLLPLFYFMRVANGLKV